MRQLNGVYTQTYNKRHGLVGHLFQGRFKSILVEKDSYLLSLCRYIVQNPVAAQITQTPEAWPWSSFRATAGLATVQEWLSVDWILGQFDEDIDKENTTVPANYFSKVEKNTIILNDEQFDIMWKKPGARDRILQDEPDFAGYGISPDETNGYRAIQKRQHVTLK